MLLRQLLNAATIRHVIRVRNKGDNLAEKSVGSVGGLREKERAPPAWAPQRGPWLEGTNASGVPGVDGPWQTSGKTSMRSLENKETILFSGKKRERPPVAEYQQISMGLMLKINVWIEVL